MKLPSFIENAPQLHLGLELYLDAFLDLNTCRSVGMAEGPIPWSAIMDYCQAYEIDGETRDNVMYHVRALDVVYMDHRAKKLGKGKPDGKSPRVRQTHKSPR